MLEGSKSYRQVDRQIVYCLQKHILIIKNKIINIGSNLLQVSKQNDMKHNKDKNTLIIS